jgi:type IV secretory pathway VirB2 component (pilin)
MTINVQFANAAVNTKDLLDPSVMNQSGLPQTDLKVTIMRIINVILGFLGIIAIIIIVLGGFKWMTCGGSEDKTKEARELIIAGIIGLVIVLAAYAIVNFVIDQYLTAMNNK